MPDAPPPIVIAGDCIEEMAKLAADSVDAICTDPPYGLTFMGRDWDAPWKAQAGEVLHDPSEAGGFQDGNGGNAFSRSRVRFGGRQMTEGRAFQVWCEQWAKEALRVLKPGGHLLAFGGTRTYHRMTAGIEDAGFEIRDCLSWMYGSGFPKSHNVSKAIDRAAGVEREPDVLDGDGFTTNTAYGEGLGRTVQERSPAVTEAARAWEGWGTALKPAFEPVVVARKPLVKNVAHNVQAHGTGALNIDACRVDMSDEDKATQEKGREAWAKSRRLGTVGEPGQGSAFMVAETGDSRTGNEPVVVPDGRWPANVLMDEAAAVALDEQTGELSSGQMLASTERGARSMYGQGNGRPTDVDTYGDSGGASRFFYVAKASSAERNVGLAGFEEQAAGGMSGRHDGSMGSITRSRNIHPTVKPIELMRWLIRLVTPPGGTVLDPFMGSGTTGCAAVLERVQFVGIEMSEEYLPIAKARIAWWAEHPEGVSIVKGIEADRKRQKVEDAGQLGLFAAPDPEPTPDRSGRAGEASAERTYEGVGGTSFAMKPGRRRP